jgi:hypothetical protein
MSDRFDFEQQIQKCWMVTDDIRDISEFVSEYPSADFTKDRVVNALNGLSDLYEVKFNKLWDLFEDVVMKLVRDEKMAREECDALREQLNEPKQYKDGFTAYNPPVHTGAYIKGTKK